MLHHAGQDRAAAEAANGAIEPLEAAGEPERQEQPKVERPRDPRKASYLAGVGPDAIVASGMVTRRRIAPEDRRGACAGSARPRASASRIEEQRSQEKGSVRHHEDRDVAKITTESTSSSSC